MTDDDWSHKDQAQIKREVLSELNTRFSDPHIDPLYSLSDEESMMSMEMSRSTPQRHKTKHTRYSHSAPIDPPMESQVDLLRNFWEEETTIEKEQTRVKSFYRESIENSKAPEPETDGSVSRKLKVGLYASDVKLLEELYIQSKRAGLPNVSRAQILRVALRHFRTCWLNISKK